MITYKQAGVDVDAGNEVVRRIRKFAKGIGFFGGLYPMGKNYLVGAADGVGTKLKLAFMLNRHETVGIDLVAMNVDDVVATGAKTLFFLDYIGCHKVHPPTIEKIIKGIAEGCRRAECQLLGGETAELSDMYHTGEYDLAGFAVGMVERGKVITGSKIRPGDRIIGLASSGLHSNGYTLARKVLFDQAKLEPKSKPDEIDEAELGATLLTPTKIYSPLVLKMIKRFGVKGIAHVTGGGIAENTARVLPKTVQAVIEFGSWPIHPIFKFIQKLGKVEQNEMYRTFNMGIGMVLVVEARVVDRALSFIKAQGEKGFLIGEIGKGKGEVIII